MNINYFKTEMNISTCLTRVLCSRVLLLEFKRRFSVGTFNDVHGRNKQNTPDVFSKNTNRFLFTYYSLTHSVENSLVKQKRIGNITVGY